MNSNLTSQFPSLNIGHALLMPLIVHNVHIDQHILVLVTQDVRVPVFNQSEIEHYIAKLSYCEVKTVVDSPNASALCSTRMPFRSLLSSPSLPPSLLQQGCVGITQLEMSNVSQAWAKRWLTSSCIIMHNCVFPIMQGINYPSR